MLDKWNDKIEINKIDKNETFGVFSIDNKNKIKIKI